MSLDRPPPQCALTKGGRELRRQLEAGDVPPAYRLEHRRQEERRARGCPGVEALCGWTDGELRRNSLRHRLTVWRHVRLHGCRACQVEIAMIVGVAHPAGEVQLPDQRRAAWPGHAPKRPLPPRFPSQAPLAWVSGALVVAVGLSFWLLSQHGVTDMARYRSESPPIERGRERPQPSSERATDDQAARTIIWGD
jgi:hypothetical protein